MRLINTPDHPIGARLGRFHFT